MDAYELVKRNMRFCELWLKFILLVLAGVIIGFQFSMVLSGSNEKSAYVLDITKSANVTVPAHNVTDITSIKVGFYGMCVTSGSILSPTCFRTEGETAEKLFAQLPPSPFNVGKDPLELTFALHLQKNVLSGHLFMMSMPFFIIGSMLLAILACFTPDRPRLPSYEIQQLRSTVCTTAAMSFLFVLISGFLALMATTSYSTTRSNIGDLLPWYPQGPYIIKTSPWVETCHWVIFCCIMGFNMVQWVILYEGICPPISKITRNKTPTWELDDLSGT